MRVHRKYKIIIEDENTLESMASWSLTPLKLCVLGLSLGIISVFLGFLFVLLTPAKTHIPGYFQESERTMTEEALLKVEDLNEKKLMNQAYLANIINLLDPDYAGNDSLTSSPLSSRLPYDSLLPASAEEKRFVSRMQNREKFNISSVRSSMAAEGMLFYPVSEDGVQTQESRGSDKAVMILPANTSVMAMADGVVIARYYDDASGGFSIILQHDNGFTSRYSGLGSPLVAQGDIISGGEILSLSRTPGVRNATEVSIELWHNGIPLKPYGYINSHRHLSPPPSAPESNLPKELKDDSGNETEP